MLSLLGFLPRDFGPRGFDIARNAALAVLTIYLAWQAYALLRQRRVRARPRRHAAAAAMPAGRASGSAAAAPAQPAAPKPAVSPGAPPGAGGEALILLSLLQDRGRFLDFVIEDITAYSDAQVAAASRVVHQGCKAVINECLALAPAHAGAEGDRITVDTAADPNRYRLEGKLAQSRLTPAWSSIAAGRRPGCRCRATRARSTPRGENIVTPVEVEVR